MLYGGAAPKDERMRADRLVGLIFCGVAGSNLVLLYNHVIEGKGDWFIFVLLVCVLFPGLVPYFNLVQAILEGRLKRRWWVSTSIIGTAAAFSLVVQWR